MCSIPSARCRQRCATFSDIDSPRDLRLPDIRSMAGCIVLLGFVLYPYVYLTTRAMFLMQTANLLDVARTLGVGRARVFLRVALPLARPAIVVGLTLALLEAVNDIGASEFLGVRTLTVSIYSTWITRSDLPGATQIALAMLVVVLGLALLERRARQQRRYANDAQHPRPLQPHRLRGWRGAAALAVSTMPIAIGFLIPAAYLIDADDRAGAIRWSAGRCPVRGGGHHRDLAGGDDPHGGCGCRGGVCRPSQPQRCGGTARAGRIPRLRGAGNRARDRRAPGCDRYRGSRGHRRTASIFAVSTGLFLLGSGAALIYAYVVRFLALAADSVETGLSRVSPALDEAARTLGEGPRGLLRRIHFPLTRPALATAALLVFVDCMKELPATLLLRPLGVETLATHSVRRSRARHLRGGRSRRAADRRPRSPSGHRAGASQSRAPRRERVAVKRPER